MNTKIKNGDTRLFEQRMEMAAILGLDEPVPEKVLRTALADPGYAHNLLVVRDEREYLAYLMLNPPEILMKEEKDIPVSKLVKRATQSLVKWAGTGFSTVSNETYERRLSACNTCPNIRTPSSDQNLLYGAAGAINGKSICGKCGCVVKIKARRNTDTCPDEHPFKPRLNRWEEPYIKMAE
jgi:hypothetical protein